MPAVLSERFKAGGRLVLVHGSVESLRRGSIDAE
jgi:hypothetical protein